MPIHHTLHAYSGLISPFPHNPVFPKDTASATLLERFGINSTEAKILDPHIKLMSFPFSLLKVSGPMTIFAPKDSAFENIMAFLQHSLISTSKISFQPNQAAVSFKSLFRMHELSYKDKEELDAIKITGLKFTMNNVELTDYVHFLPQT